MNSFWITSIALGAMIVDHIGFFFFPGVLWFRLVGRISFFLFAWMLATGSQKTRDLDRYIMRVAGLAMVSQIPYSAVGSIFAGMPVFNVVFTLAIGLVAIRYVRQSEKLWQKAAIAFFAFWTAELLGSDYGGPGVLCVLAFYFFSANFRAMLLSEAAIIWLFFMLPAYLSARSTTWNDANTFNLFEIVGLLSFVPIYLYNGEPGTRRWKYLFYAFYPLQFVIVYLYFR